jgi:hypothetical protein
LNLPGFACRGDCKNQQANQGEVRESHRSCCSLTEFSKVITDLHPTSVAIPILPQGTYYSRSSTSTKDQRHQSLLITNKTTKKTSNENEYYTAIQDATQEC